MNEITDNIDIFPTIEINKMSFEAYLKYELLSDEKHEFRNGQLYLMPDVTAVHCHINGLVISVINNALDLKEDETTHVYGPSMKVCNTAKNRVVYPDVILVEGEPIDMDVSGENSTLLNPILIAEILSPETEAYDRGLKFEFYKTLPTFREYVLVSQDKPKVEVFFLKNPEENEWETTTYEGLDAVVDLRSIGCQIKMKQIYHRVFKASV